MNWPDSDEPPAKKQRFFSDPEDEVALPTPPTRSPLVEKRANSDASHHRSNPGPSSELDDSASVQFDQDIFESFIGEKVSPDVLGIIRRSCGGSLERAVNMFLDGSWKKLQKSSLNARHVTQPNQLKRNSPNADVSMPDVQPAQPVTLPIHRSMPNHRYIGAFGAEGWATRSGSNMMKHGDHVNIERQKSQPPQSKGKMRVVTPSRVDVVVRFTDSKGSEIGRLARDTANWVSSLIDQNVCRFEGTCVYAPDRLRTNDTVYLQLRCYILKTSFQKGSSSLAANRDTGLFEVQETGEERDLRLRQVALVRLFQEINLLPTRAAANDSRQGLLKAAEAAENKAKEKAKQLSGVSKK